MKNREYVGLCLILAVFSASCKAPANPEGLTVKVERVVSGQTLEVTGLSPQSALLQKVRLIGIEAPDLDQEPWGYAAKQQLENEIEGQTIVLESDVEPEDAYGRRLAYVWLNGQLVNEQLVKQGYALAAPRSPNTKHEQRLTQAQEWAKIMGLGIWNPEKPLRESPGEFRQQNR